MSKLIKILRSSGDLAGAWAGLELAGNGHVHAHTLSVFPPGIWAQDETELATLAEFSAKVGRKEAWKRLRKSLPGLNRQATALEAVIRAAGFDEVADARPADKSAVVEVVKYSVKSPSWESTVDPETKRPELVHPYVGAHWALATRGMRLAERYGAARGVPIEAPLDAPIEAPLDAPIACPGCGSDAESDRWWLQGRADRVAAWARKTWRGKTDVRLCGTWPREGPRKTEVSAWAAELFPGPLKDIGYSVGVDRTRKFCY